MKQLILAEKPSVARDLSRILGADEKHRNYFEGKDVIVTWALGHLLGLRMPEDLNPDWQKWQMETLPMLPKHIGTKPLPKTRGQLKTIEQLSKRSDVSEAVIATDAGREGELVARWILQYVRFKKPVKRLWISSQTTKAVKEGFANLKPAEDYDNLYQSALARATADWLVGLNVTRALTVKYQDNLSAGRVQTPTLALVLNQERRIEGFVPRKYYQIVLNVNGQKAQMEQKDQYALKTRAETDEIVAGLEKCSGTVEKISEKEHTQQAPLPYDLTELQRAANEKYGYSARKTLSLVQSLYEVHKIVSYPRTDSKYLSTDMIPTMKERLLAVRGMVPEAGKYAQKGAKVVQKKVFNDAKVTDHHALVPTEQVPDYARLSSDEHRIYAMIVRRFVMLFAPEYRERKEKVTVKFGDGRFNFTKTEVLEKGWKENAQAAGEALHFKQGQAVSGTFAVVEKLTTPPNPLTEGTLLALMEKYSLGTPATRAEIIEKLVSSELMERSGNSLHVTRKGRQLLDLVNPSLVTPELTEKWEKQLEEIARGSFSSEEFIAGIREDTKKLVSEVRNSTREYQDFSLTQKKCPECGSLLREKKVRDGRVLVCSNAECDYRRRAEARVSNHRCPQCHRKMLVVSGANGDYFRCKFDGTTEKLGGRKGRKKMSRHETRRLMEKVNQDDEPQESALAEALRRAMEK